MEHTPEILYEDADVLALNKPAGLVVHQDGKTDEPTLVDWLLERFPEIRSVGEPLRLPDGAVVDRPGIVHRIDREASGVLVVAQNQRAFAHLKAQFRERRVEKTYRAFVHGSFKERAGSIDWPIGKSKKDFRLRIAINPRVPAARQARGKLRDALTEYTVLRQLGEEGATYVEARPLTGRTHQLRVHFKAQHHPIVCDKLYAPRRECILGFERLALHARTIALTLPSGEALNVKAPLPEDFTRALDMLS